jgi:uroporphyrinogen III methyltransferase/synthase
MDSDATNGGNERTSNRPLESRTIIITRAKAQSADFIALLEGYGARVILCPTIEITELESYDRLDEALGNLYGYDWLIFPSVNAVEFFLKRLEFLGQEVVELDDVRVCAIGEATALRLREASVHVDLVPLVFKAEGVFEALQGYIGGRQNIEGLNFLIPRAAVARDYLPQALEEAGARVDVAPAYRTVSPQSTEKRRIETLLAGGGVDCITFTSSSTVTNFAKLFDTDNLPKLLSGVAIACIGDVTASTALDLGLKCHIVPREFTIPALGRAVADYFSLPGH